MMRKKWGLAAAAALMLALGCKDNNLFRGLHSEGSGDTATVLSQADAALANKEFFNAQAYYESVLAREPRNSEALYGAALAGIGAAGLDLGTLISNVITKKQAAAPSLVQAIDHARFGAPGSASVDPDSLLQGLNLEGMRNYLNPIICRLTTIQSGAGDGKVPHDDVSLLIGITITRTLRAALRLYDAGIVDIRKTSDGKDYEVTVVEANVNAYCGDINAGSLVEQSLDDLAYAVEALQTAFVKVAPDSGSTLAEIKVDIEAAFNEFKTKLQTDGGSLSPGCINLLSNKHSVSSLPRPTQPNCVSGPCCG